jgi:SEC-C motif
MKVSRNAPCPCGSGRKYKLCHGGAHQTEQSTGAKVRLVFLALLILAGLVLAVLNFRTPGAGHASRVAAPPPDTAAR